MSGRTRGRPPAQSASDTRHKILVSTRELLAENGFDRTTVRAVAARASVDPALIHHYFGTKADLVREALHPPVDESDIFAGMPTDAALAGPEFVRRVVTQWDTNTVLREHIIGVLRVGLLHQDVLTQLREVQKAVVSTALGEVVADDPDLRLGLIAAEMLGLVMMRYVVNSPELASASPEVLAAAMGPTITRYLTGNLATGHSVP